jgi:hypothetical protein
MAWTFCRDDFCRGRLGRLDSSAHDHHWAQTALGLVVGGRDLGSLKAGEQELLLLAQESLAKAFGSGIA